MLLLQQFVVILHLTNLRLLKLLSVKYTLLPIYFNLLHFISFV